MDLFTIKKVTQFSCSAVFKLPHNGYGYMK
jgi:hypothetical protein